jgi:hypothetical protein
MRNKNRNDTNSIDERQNTLVPNLVHFVWFGKGRRFNFCNAMALVSAKIFIKPDVIFFHGDGEPVGQWWEYAKKNVSDKLQLVHRKIPHRISGKKVTKIEHSSDYARLQILLGMLHSYVIVLQFRK